MIDSFRNAFRGIFLLLRTERNFQIHFAALAVVIAAGLYFDITRGEWAMVLVMSAVIFGLEGLNSAVEKLCDEVTMERKESIRNIKDVAAGAVLVAALIAVIVGVIVFYPYFKSHF
ncbi:diacylglycerol kinase family protein [Crocinitomicaceae bacterium]|nr:diacylglycerol kinase family protein [Crocinitomicaceae bacterium]MDB3907229.1 diacylglycerol kinase family protein [Crocinitomicaceae bacterium]